jgi:hypothetical protein
MCGAFYSAYHSEIRFWETETDGTIISHTHIIPMTPCNWQTHGNLILEIMGHIVLQGHFVLAFGFITTAQTGLIHTNH